jgi:hypothetical protein
MAVLNINSPQTYRVGENDRGFQIDMTYGNLTGATATAVLKDFSTGAPVPGYSGSIMAGTIAQAVGPGILQWSLPNPLIPVLPIGVYRLYFKIVFASGRIGSSNDLQIIVKAA